MVSVMSADHSINKGPHVTITHSALDLTIQRLSHHTTALAPQTWGLTAQGPPGPLLVTHDGQDLKPVQTCSPKDSLNGLLLDGFSLEVIFQKDSAKVTNFGNVKEGVQGVIASSGLTVLFTKPPASQFLAIP